MRSLGKRRRTRLRAAQDRADARAQFSRKITSARRRTFAKRHDAELRRAAATLDRCGRWLSRYRCPSHGHWAHTEACKHALCATCSATRRARFLRKYGESVTSYTDRRGAPRAVMLTLTQAGRPDENYRAGVRRLRRAHSRLVTRLRKECPGIGGLTSYEATARPDQTWHVHAHILLSLPAELPAQWAHPNQSPTFRPVNMWRVRWAWAVAHLDLRTREGKERAGRLQQFADWATGAWAEKMIGRDGAKERDADACSYWGALCAGYGIPSVCDVRTAPPSEALKYITKGVVQRDNDAGPNLFTDWHVVDLVVSIRGMRRTDAWGGLYRLQAEIDLDQDVDQDVEDAEIAGQAAADEEDVAELDRIETRPCPVEGCDHKCPAVSMPHDHLTGLQGKYPFVEAEPCRSDWILRAMSADARPAELAA